MVIHLNQFFYAFYMLRNCLVVVIIEINDDLLFIFFKDNLALYEHFTLLVLPL